MVRRIAGHALTAVCSAMRTCGIVVVATVVFALVFSIEPDDGALNPHSASGPLEVSSAITSKRVRMSVGSGLAYSIYSLEGEDGEELLRVTYVRPGDVVVNLGEAFPSRPSFSLRSNGDYEFVMAQDGIGRRLNVKAVAASGFVVESCSYPVMQDAEAVAPDECTYDPTTTNGP